MCVDREIDGPQREMNPAAEQSDAAVPRPREQVVAQQFAHERQHAGIGGGMEAMAAVIDLQAGELEAAGVAADAVGLFEDGDLVSVASESKSGAEPRRSGAENRHARQAIYCTLRLADRPNIRMPAPASGHSSR